VKVTVALPRLLYVAVPLTVEPTGALLWLSTRLTETSTGKTVTTAVAVVALLPTEVDNDPGGIVLVPLDETVTTAETEQDDPGLMTVLEGRIKLSKPGTAVGVPPKQVVAAEDGEALTTPAG
jgi:hypothetical protein